jgi:adiponectin receptor
MASAYRLRVPHNEPDARKECALENIALQPGSEQTGCLDLLCLDDMPEWFQHDNNQWIICGYRPISNSVYTSFCSWLYRHNKTVNIYSHLIPAVFFFVGKWYLLQYLAGRYNKLTSTDIVAFSFFMLAATICYASSALNHTLMNHSHDMDRFCHRLDMLGIGIFIVGDIVLGVHILFWCETTIRTVYWCMVSRSPDARLFMFPEWSSELTKFSSVNRLESSGQRPSSRMLTPNFRAPNIAP